MPISERRPLDDIDGGGDADRRLGDGEHVLGHRVARPQLLLARANGGEPPEEPLVAAVADRFRAVDEAPHALEGDVADLLVPHGGGEELVREIGEEAEGSPVPLDRLEEHGRPQHPVERGHLDERNPAKQREQKAGDQPHVVVEREPGDDNVVVPEPEGVSVAPDLVQHGLMAQRDTLLESGRPRGVLQKQGLAGGGDRPLATEIRVVSAHLDPTSIQELAGNDLLELECVEPR